MGRLEKMKRLMMEKANKRILKEQDEGPTHLEITTELYNAVESVREAIEAIEGLDSLPENDPQNPNQDKQKYIGDLKRIEEELEDLRSWFSGVLPYGKTI